MGDLLTQATSEMLDTFRGQLHQVVTDDFARAFCSANPRAGNLCAGNQFVFDDGTAWRPFIGLQSATEERPCWSDLVRTVWPCRSGQACLVMIVDDYKKRLWPYARVGVLGRETLVFVHDYSHYGTEAIEMVGWSRMINCLDLVEEVYGRGWPKRVIRDNLMSHLALVRKIGVREVNKLEHELSEYRGSSEFRVALMIAQRRV